MTARNRTSKADWELAGLEDAESWRPIDAPVVPKGLQLDSDALRYDYGAVWRERAWPADLLSAFVALADADDDKILSFAKRCGVLDLCAHNLPRTHGSRENEFFCREGQPGVEPCDVWRWYAAEARAVLNAVSRLRQKQLVEKQDWITLSAHPSSDRPAPLIGPRGHLDPRFVEATSMEPDWAWRQVIGVVNEWLGMAAVRPMVQWDRFPRERHTASGVDLTFGPKGPRIELGGGLFGALALQLAAIVTGTSGVEQCSSCGHYFTREKARAARRGPGRYCRDCQGSDEAVRLAAKAYRDRKKRALSLHEDGLTIRDIAAAVKSTPETVEGWLGSKGGKTTRATPARRKRAGKPGGNAKKERQQ